MKVAVTGAGGYLGSALARQLVESGYHVLIVLNHKPDSGESSNGNIKIVCQDLTEKDGCAGIFKGYDAVVHCAALRRDFGRWEDFRKSNIEITRNVMENALKDEVAKIIHISTTAIYGNERNHVGTDEVADYGERVVDYYTRSKIEGEKIVTGMIDDKRLPAIILRPGYIWGPGDKRILPFLVRGLKSKHLTIVNNGENFLSLSYIDNVVEAIKLALEKNDILGRIFNITDGSKVTSKRFISDIISALGIEYKLRNSIYPLLYGGASLTEAYYRLVHRKSQPPFTKYMARFLRYDAFFDISRAMFELEYKPRISYKEAITLVTPYLRSLYYGQK